MRAAGGEGAAGPWSQWWAGRECGRVPLARVAVARAAQPTTPAPLPAAGTTASFLPRGTARAASWKRCTTSGEGLGGWGSQVPTHPKPAFLAGQARPGLPANCEGGRRAAWRCAATLPRCCPPTRLGRPCWIDPPALTPPLMLHTRSFPSAAQADTVHRRQAVVGSLALMEDWCNAACPRDAPACCSRMEARWEGPVHLLAGGLDLII